jgi:hypothetical protein
MQKEFVLKSWKLISDAINPNNGAMVMLAIDDLFWRIELDKMNCIEDYISFKNEWYPQIKNK